MKALFVILILCSFDTTAQTLLGKEFYLNHRQVSKTAKDYFNGKFMASDDQKTFSIIDSLKTKNNETRPFYILLVSTITQKADGALSEALGMSCKEFIESNPNELLDFLYSKNSMVKKDFLDSWAYLIASEFMIDCDEKAKSCISMSLSKATKNIRVDNKSRLSLFYKKIESYTS